MGNLLDDEVEDVLPEDAITDDEMVEELFTNAFDKQPESEFLVDVYDWWEKKGFLTVKQWNSVSAIADGD